MKKEKQIINFSDLVSLVNEEQDIDNVINNNLQKKNLFKQLLHDKKIFYSKIKSLLPQSVSFNNKTLWVTAYISLLFALLSFIINLYSTPWYSFLSTFFVMVTVFFTYSTNYFIYQFHKHNYQNLIHMVLSFDTNSILKILQFESPDEELKVFSDKNKSIFYRFFSKINVGYKYSFINKILKKFPDIPKPYRHTFQDRQLNKIERIRNFLNLLIYFNQTKEIKKTNFLLPIFTKISYLPYIGAYVYSLFNKSEIYIPLVIAWSLILLFIHIFYITHKIFKNPIQEEFDYYVKKSELAEIFSLSDFQESLITIGFFSPNDLLLMSDTLTLDDFIDHIRKLTPEAQDLIIKSLTKIINTPLNEYQTPIIFNS